MAKAKTGEGMAEACRKAVEVFGAATGKDTDGVSFTEKIRKWLAKEFPDLDTSLKGFGPALNKARQGAGNGRKGSAPAEAPADNPKLAARPPVADKAPGPGGDLVTVATAVVELQRVARSVGGLANLRKLVEVLPNE
jgi:hypothetical protein